MGFSETFVFPEVAFSDFMVIHDNICGDPCLENMTGLPKWFRKKYGITCAADITKLYDRWDWYELDVITYDENTGKMTIEGDGTEGEYSLDTAVVCEILESIMCHYNIPDGITIRETAGFYSELLENGYGGIVYAISRDGHRRLTTDWLAEQMRLGKI